MSPLDIKLTLKIANAGGGLHDATLSFAKGLHIRMSLVQVELMRKRISGEL